jgi:hypothetical protein
MLILMGKRKIHLFLVSYTGSEMVNLCNVTGKPPGYDRVRSAEIGNKDFELDVLEEAYTTEHWLVRIYKVCR